MAADGSGDYTTVQEAFDALPVDNKPHIVRLRPGTYTEKVTLTSRHPYVTLIGDDAASCIITWDDYAGRDNGAGGTLGTSGSQTFLIEANDFTASHVTIANTYVNSQANTAVNEKRKPSRFRSRPTARPSTNAASRATRIRSTAAAPGVSTCATATSRATSTSSSGRRRSCWTRCTLHMNRNNSVVTARRPLRTTTTASSAWTARSPSVEQRDGFRRCGILLLLFGTPVANAPRAVFPPAVRPASLKAEDGPKCRPTRRSSPNTGVRVREPRPSASHSAPNGGRQLTDAEAAEYTVERSSRRRAPRNTPSTGFRQLRSPTRGRTDHPEATSSDPGWN